MNVLVIDVGGTNVKILATGQQEPIKFPRDTQAGFSPNLNPTTSPGWLRAFHVLLSRDASESNHSGRSRNGLCRQGNLVLRVAVVQGQTLVRQVVHILYRCQS